MQLDQVFLGDAAGEDVFQRRRRRGRRERGGGGGWECELGDGMCGWDLENLWGDVSVGMLRVGVGRG